MNRYYISEINLKKIRNKINFLNILENKLEKKESYENMIITTDGYYKLEKDNYIKYKIINTEYFETKQNDLTIIGNIFKYKKYGEQFHIPIENDQIHIKKCIFNIPNNKTIFMVLEFYKNKLNDLYFLSKKDIREKNIFFLQDISLFMETLNI